MRKNNFSTFFGAVLMLLTAPSVFAKDLRADDLQSVDLLAEERALLMAGGADAWDFVGFADVDPVPAKALPPTPYTPGIRVFSEDEDRLFGTHEADEGDRLVFVAENGAMFRRRAPQDTPSEGVESGEWLPDLAEFPELAPEPDKRIFGSDNRTLWRNTTSYPERAHVAIRYGANDTTAGCSGVMIGPRHVLTAAHCFIDNGRFFVSRSDLRVVFGQDGSGNGSAQTPFGKSTVSHWLFPQRWLTNNYWKWWDDYALLVLPDSTFSPGWLGFRAYGYSTLYRLNVNINGYPGHSLKCAASPRSDGLCGGFLYHGFGRLGRIYTYSLWTRVDWQSGQSGSPVYRFESSNGSRTVVGVVSGHNSRWNRATRIRGAIANALCTAIGDFPSSHFDHNCQR